MTNTALFSVILMLSMIGFGSSHLCMLSPPQRGSMMGINKPGAPDCALETGPCGGRNSSFGTPIAIKEGSKFVVAFQKNLDHFAGVSSPGSFKISASFDEEKTFQLLNYLPDTSAPSLSLYYLNVTMPEAPLNKPGTLRVSIQILERYTCENKRTSLDFISRRGGLDVWRQIK